MRVGISLLSGLFGVRRDVVRPFVRHLHCIGLFPFVQVFVGRRRGGAAARGGGQLFGGSFVAVWAAGHEFIR